VVGFRSRAGKVGDGVGASVVVGCEQATEPARQALGKNMKFIGRHVVVGVDGEERIELQSEAIRHLALKALNGVAEGVFRTFQAAVVAVVIAKYRSQVPNELSETNDRSCRELLISDVGGGGRRHGRSDLWYG